MHTIEGGQDTDAEARLFTLEDESLLYQPFKKDKVRVDPDRERKEP